MFTRHPDLHLVEAIDIAFFEALRDQSIHDLMEKEREKQQQRGRRV